MNVSMAAAILLGDAAGASQPATGDAGEGEVFGLAVKSVEQKHAGKQAAAKHPTLRGARSEPGEQRSGEVATDADAPDTDVANGAATPADVLGRLLEAVLPSAPAAAPRAVQADATRQDATGDDAADGALQERIVISTVADLAGSAAEGGEKSRRVSLRVTGMETHFEPRLDGAALVEAADRPSAPQPPVAGERAVAVPKQAFDEILQRLGNEPSGDERGDAKGERHNGKVATTSSRSGTHAQGEASFAPARSTQTVSDRPEPSARNASTGQLVNAQIAERIVDAFGGRSEAPSGSSNAPQTAGAAQLLRMTAGGAALKTLSIQLEPQDLGRVDVAMRLIDGRLQVELAASEPATAAALAGDRHGLRKILEHAGFALGDAAISIVSRDLGQGAATAAPASSGADGGRQAGDGSSGFDRPSDDRSSGGGRAPNDRRRQADEGKKVEPSGRSNSAAGSVYL